MCAHIHIIGPTHISGPHHFRTLDKLQKITAPVCTLRRPSGDALSIRAHKADVGLVGGKYESSNLHRRLPYGHQAPRHQRHSANVILEKQYAHVTSWLPWCGERCCLGAPVFMLAPHVPCTTVHRVVSMITCMYNVSWPMAYHWLVYHSVDY